MIATLAFIELYLSPFFLAIALVFLLNGIINYFIIGVPGFEEDRREMGRQSLLWTALFLTISLALFGISSWLVSLSDRVDVDTEVQSGTDILRIPNVPTSR